MSASSISFQKRLNEVFLLEPNNLGVGFLTNLYKKIVARFKVAPFIILIPTSFMISALAYLVFGYLLINLVSLLQYGF